jgi:hypothetical protein
VGVRQVIKRLSVGLVLSAEAVGALVLHESHSLLIAAVIVVAAILLTAWLLETGLDKGVKHFNSVAKLVGASLNSRGNVHGWWYTKVCDEDNLALGGSVLEIRAGIEDFDLEGHYLDLSADPSGDQWTWWIGTGKPFAERAILFDYEGREKDNPDEGFGMYEFTRGATPQAFNGSFYGKQLPRESRYRTVTGTRVAKSDVTREFVRNSDKRKELLIEHLNGGRPAQAVPAVAPAADARVTDDDQI